MKCSKIADLECRGVKHKAFRFNFCDFRLPVANGKVEGMGSRSSRTQSQCELSDRDHT